MFLPTMNGIRGSDPRERKVRAIGQSSEPHVQVQLWLCVKCTKARRGLSLLLRHQHREIVVGAAGQASESLSGTDSIEVKHLVQTFTYRAAIIVAGHYLGHVLPPSPAHIGRGDGLPERFILNLGVGKKLASARQQENGIVGNSVLLEHTFQLLPNRLMPTPVFLLTPILHRHDKGFPKLHTGVESVPALGNLVLISKGRQETERFCRICLRRSPGASSSWASP